MNARVALFILCILVLFSASACSPAATAAPSASYSGSAAGSGSGSSKAASGSSAASGSEPASGSSAASSGMPAKAMEPAAAAESAPAEAPAGGSSSAIGSSSAVGSSSAEVAAPAATAPGSPAKPQSGILTAGEVDDHLNFPFFQGYVRRALAGRQDWPSIPVSDRVTLHIIGADERPVSNAWVRITPVNADLSPFNTVAGTDGRLEFWPTFDFGQAVADFQVAIGLPDESEPRYTTTVNEVQLEESGRVLNIQLSQVRQADSETAAPALDLMLVIDTTGSMGDELSYITREFQSIVGAVRERYPTVDMRFGLVVYRDQYDQYVVRSSGFTASAEQMQTWLAEQRADGGGDEPEAVPDALQAALDAEWRGGNTARVLIHIADAPPHNEAFKAYLDRIHDFRRSGIRVYPVAASSTNDTAEYLMRHAALLTQARYLFLTDDSGVGNAHSEPKIPCYVVTRLDQLIERVVLSELSGKRFEPRPEDIIRVTGAYENGVCGE